MEKAYYPNAGESTGKITGTAGSNVASTKTNRIVTVYTTKNKATENISAANAVPPVANADLKSPSPTSETVPELPANSPTVMADAKIPSLTPANEVQSRNATSGKSNRVTAAINANDSASPYTSETPQRSPLSGSNIPFLRSDVDGSGVKSSG